MLIFFKKHKYLIIGFLVLFVIAGCALTVALILRFKTTDDKKEGETSVSTTTQDVVEKECGVEQCHGMDLTCGEDVPEICTEIYQIGDGCRQYFECEKEGDSCHFVENESFGSCTACVSDCIRNYEDAEDQFRCEEECKTEIETTWKTYLNKDLKIAFKYPSAWEVVDLCKNQNVNTDCSIISSYEGYAWQLYLDPIVTGGGFGFIVPSVPGSGDDAYQLFPDDFEVTLITQYVDKGGDDVWNGSEVFGEYSNDSFTYGFGDGGLWDSTPNNYYSISYFSNASGSAPIPVVGDEDLEEAIMLMDIITNSLDFSGK